MERNTFLKTLITLPVIGGIMKLADLYLWKDNLEATDRMPVLFLGHGSPMNAIEENQFVQGFRNVSKSIPVPQAIICVSAHWETKGTFVTAMEHPRTIHDFGGFPKELFAQQYPAPGSPALANTIKNTVTKTQVGLDQSWGLDHGAWTVIKHLYPKANIPTIQLSLDYTQAPEYHYALAKELAILRDKGVLIIGSGNMVHNLGLAQFSKMNEDNFAFDWATEASTKMKNYILDDQHDALVRFKSHGKAFDLAIPTPEHYLPLLYTLALKDKKDKVKLFNDKAIAGSLSMTSVQIG